MSFSLASFLFKFDILAFYLFLLFVFIGVQLFQCFLHLVRVLRFRFFIRLFFLWFFNSIPDLNVLNSAVSIHYFGCLFGFFFSFDLFCSFKDIKLFISFFFRNSFHQYDKINTMLQINYMFFTARKPKTRKINPSHSKDSKQSIRSSTKQTQHTLMIASTAELRLREAINRKFQKSDIKDFKYQCFARQSKSEQSSRKSEQIQEYQDLKGRRFVNIKDYYSRKNDQPGCKYTIRRRQVDYRRPRISSQLDSFSPLPNSGFQKKQENKLFLPHPLSKEKERRTLSGDKRQQWQKIGFEYHSTSKNMDKQRKSPRKEDDRNQRVFYFRKEQGKIKTQGPRNN